MNKKEGYKIKPKSNPHFSNQYSRYKKVLPPPETKESESDPNYSLKKYSKQLVNKVINPDEYREILRQHGINPNVEVINKVIRQHEVGNSIKYNDLLVAVLKNKDTKFDPTKVNFEIKRRKYYSESEPAEDMIMISQKTSTISKGATSQLSHCTKKKKINCKYNSYTSNKEIFDWEASTLTKLKSGELNPPALCDGNNKHKIVFKSNIFDDTPITDSPPKKKRTSTAFFKGSVDFFTWKGGDAKTPEKKEIKRRNPNETSKEEVKENKPVKINKMLLSSPENGLITKK